MKRIIISDVHNCKNILNLLRIETLFDLKEYTYKHFHMLCRTYTTSTRKILLCLLIVYRADITDVKEYFDRLLDNIRFLLPKENLERS